MVQCVVDQHVMIYVCKLIPMYHCNTKMLAFEKLPDWGNRLGYISVCVISL